MLLGGRDTALIADLASGLETAGIATETCGHKYLGRNAMNICNRGTTGEGVQFELSMQFRRSSYRKAFVSAVRTVLLSRQNAADPR